MWKAPVIAFERVAVVLPPLIECERLNRIAGGSVFLKLETLQHTGTFKYRGAFNRLSRLTSEERKGGVVAYSTGNFGIGVAAAGSELGIDVVIVMPNDAPNSKQRAVVDFGATLRLFDRASEDREQIAAAIASRNGASVVTPGDDGDVIAGQGTVGLEVLEEADQSIDYLVCPCGGASLVAGCCLAFEGRSENTTIIAVEPVGFDDTRRSIDLGKRVQNVRTSGSICDAILTRTPAPLSWEILRSRPIGSAVVGDEAVKSALRFAFDTLKVVIEPSGAIGLAAILDGQLDVAGKTTAVVCTGANVDRETFISSVS